MEDRSVVMVILSGIDIMESGPRPHHYQFAHHVLADLARNVGTRMLDKEPPQGFGAVMVSLWDDLGGRLPAEARLPSDGLSATLITLGRHRLMVIVLPRPAGPSEAYYTAVVEPGGASRCRYFTLEHAVNPITGEPYTVIGEWADGSHINYGPGPASDLSAFLTAVVELLGESESGGGGRPARAGQQEGRGRRVSRRLFGR